MDQPKFKKGQIVKFKGDSNGMAGKILSFSYDSENGYIYRVSSKYYDAEVNDMVEGFKVLREKEVVDMTEEVEKSKKDK